MSLSTSSSSPPPIERRGLLCRQEWKVLLCLAALLLISEAALRLTERKLSIDVDHIRSASEIAEVIEKDSKTLTSKVHQVLFVGNSSIRKGLDPQILVNEFKSRYGLEVKPYFFYPDGGNIGAWRWAWRKYFMSRDVQPDWVVLCGGESHFDDGLTEPRTAAAYFVSHRDALTFASTELSGMEQRLEFFAAKASLSYASRKRVQRRIMDSLMPYNREVLFDMVTVAGALVQKQESAPHRLGTSVGLDALLKDIRQQGPQTAVLFVPNLDSYEIPATRETVISQSGAILCDLRHLHGIDATRFFDNAHLDAKGAQIFTRELCARLQSAMTQPNTSPKASNPFTPHDH
jgi:hypothetical protein